MRRLHSVPLLVAMLVLSTAARAATQPPPDPGAYFRYANCTPAPYQCGQVEFGLNYPFAVDGVARPDYCSSPGHRLFCVNNTLTINLTTGGSFQVTGVDYGNQALAVIDQSLAHEPACPHAYRNTTIDAAAFAYTDRDRFLTAYVNCTGDTRSLLPPVHDAFACVAGGRSYFMLDNGTSAPEDVLGLGLGVECSSILVVPYDSAMADALATGNATLGGAVRAGFTVRWKAGDGWCGACQASGGRCGHDSRAPGDHTCFCPGGQVIGSCPSGSGIQYFF